MYWRNTEKDYWDIYPEQRTNYRSAFTPQEIKDFIALEDELSASNDPNWYPANAWRTMTARQYYEACAVVYNLLNFPLREKRKFIDTEVEHERYGEATPKELYYMFADGRDNGLKNVPMDDANELNLWLEQKGQYFEFNGSHHWEIIPDGSTLFSMHLGINHEPERKFLYLSGEMLERSKQTVRAFLALWKKGYPVKLIGGKQMLERFTETDCIELLPHYSKNGFGSTSDDMLDAVTLDDGDKPELVAAKAIWKPNMALELKDIY